MSWLYKLDFFFFDDYFGPQFRNPKLFCYFSKNADKM